MREQMMDQDLETVVGGIVRVSGNKMQVAFTTMRKVYHLKNCEASEASLLAQILYNQHNDECDLAYETVVMEAFQNNGWI